MNKAWEYQRYLIFQEGEVFVARHMFADDDTEEMESRSVDGLIRMIDQIVACVAQSGFENPRMPDFYERWLEQGCQGRIVDPVKHMPHVLLAGAGAFFVEREQDNKPRVHRAQPATILNFTARPVVPQIKVDPVRSDPVVDFTRMRGPLPKWPALGKRIRYSERSKLAAQAAMAGMTIPLALAAISGPASPLFMTVIAGATVVVGAADLYEAHRASRGA